MLFHGSFRLLLTTAKEIPYLLKKASISLLLDVGLGLVCHLNLVYVCMLRADNLLSDELDFVVLLCLMQVGD